MQRHFVGNWIAGKFKTRLFRRSYFWPKAWFRHNGQNFTTEAAKGAAKVRKGGSNTIAARHDLCALCAGIVPFVVKNHSYIYYVCQGRFFLAARVQFHLRGAQEECSRISTGIELPANSKLGGTGC
jgi:hypothetical protein